MKRLLFVALILAAGVARAQSTTTSQMRLVLPVPGQTSGPAYAQMLVTAFGLVDSHDHTTGKGVRIPVAGLNMNADLGLNGYNLSGVRGLRLNNQSLAFSAPADVREIYSVGGDLYWNNGSGTAVQLTSGAGLNAASIGGIGGDYVGSGSSAYYSSSQKLFTFDSSSGVRAGMAAGPFYLYDPQSGGKYVLLSVPSGLAANYQLTLPSSLPSSTQVLTLSSAGQISPADSLSIGGTFSAGSTITSSATGFRAPDGTVSAPAFSFSNETGSGIYRIGVSNPAIAVSGLKRQEWTSTGTAVTGTLSVTGNTTVGGNATVSGTLGVSGAVTATGGGVFGVSGIDRLFISNLSGVSTQHNGLRVSDVGAPIASGDAVNLGWYQGREALLAPLASPTFTGTVTVPTLSVSTAATVPTPTLSGHAATKGYVDAGPAFTGKPTAPATSAGDGATTLATKGYVDAATALTDRTSAIVWGTQWSGSDTRLYKQANGVVILMLNAVQAGGTSTTVLTLPAGCRPSVQMYVMGAAGLNPMFFYVNTDGTVVVASDPASAIGHGLNVVFPGI